MQGITKDTQASHWAKKDIQIIESYWTSPIATKRSLWFCEQLKQYSFQSIFEIGFFSGRNLKYIADAFPNVDVGGIEINKKAVQFAKQKLPSAFLSQLNLHDFDSMDIINDIVFTSGVLIHVPPQDIRSAIEKILRKTTKYVMHIEQIGSNELIAGPKELKPTYKVSDQIQFSPDIIHIYQELGFNPQIVNLPDDVKTNGAKELIIVKV